MVTRGSFDRFNESATKHFSLEEGKSKAEEHMFHFIKGHSRWNGCIKWMINWHHGTAGGALSGAFPHEGSVIYDAVFVLFALLLNILDRFILNKIFASS